MKRAWHRLLVVGNDVLQTALSLRTGVGDGGASLFLPPTPGQVRCPSHSRSTREGGRLMSNTGFRLKSRVHMFTCSVSYMKLVIINTSACNGLRMRSIINIDNLITSWCIDASCILLIKHKTDNLVTCNLFLPSADVSRDVVSWHITTRAATTTTKRPCMLTVIINTYNSVNNSELYTTADTPDFVNSSHVIRQTYQNMFISKHWVNFIYFYKLIKDETKWNMEWM